jgi:hypothetical protein
MTVSRTFAIVPSAGVSAYGAVRAHVEKPNKTHQPRHDRRRDDAKDARARVHDHRRSSSQNGTRDDAPFWNGPRLRAPFVAQIIGQLTGENAPDARSALASYAQIEPPHAFFDRSV